MEPVVLIASGGLGGGEEYGLGMILAELVEDPVETGVPLEGVVELKGRLDEAPARVEQHEVGVAFAGVKAQKE
jgi:hypothetical protein